MSTTPHEPAAIIWQPRNQLEQPAIELDADGRLDKSTLLRALSDAFDFPEYFGENWDAAYDLLLDQVEQLTGPALWRFSINGSPELNESDLADWVRLMTDVCAYAESQELRVQVAVYSDVEITGADPG